LIPLVNFTSPSEHQANCPPLAAPHHLKCASPPGSSPKVSRPSSASRAKRLLTAGLPHPLRSVFAVSHSLDGLLRFAPFPGIAPGNTHGILALQGYSRIVGSHSISEVAVPSWRFREQLRFERGPEGPCHSPAPTGSYSTSRTLVRSFSTRNRDGAERPQRTRRVRPSERLRKRGPTRKAQEGIGPLWKGNRKQTATVET
jgi:hypothetical protein